LKIIRQQINGNVLFPGIILTNPRQKRLRKIKTTDPKRAGFAIVHPILVKDDSFQKIRHPGPQRFQTGVTGPFVWVQ
jgi:hypothetical protein